MVLEIALFYPHKVTSHFKTERYALLGAQPYEVFKTALAQILNPKEK
jgi:predicted DsbA family dithiol-disulfide isomerase